MKGEGEGRKGGGRREKKGKEKEKGTPCTSPLLEPQSKLSMSRVWLHSGLLLFCCCRIKI